MTNSRHRSIVPPYLLARIAEAEGSGLERAALAARRSLLADPPLRAERRREALLPPVRTGATDAPPLSRTVFDAGGRETLPGRLVRSEGEAESADVAVNEA
ncbi:MAG: peptidase M4 family protein, partial [Herbiconiux sp.]|nr:peptidase M4 family protein [Herbiconiux sp.]